MTSTSGTAAGAYVLSGAIPPQGLAAAVAGTTVAAAALGWFYTEVNLSAVGDIFFLEAFPSLVAGYVVGLVASWMIQVGKIRNQSVAGPLTLFGAAVGLYVAWAHDYSARGLVPDATFTLSPAVVWSYVEAFYASGGWSLEDSGAPVTGALLAMFWLLEASFFFGGAWFGCKDELERAVFCEACDRWAKVERGVREIPRDAYNTLAPQLMAGDADALATGQFGIASGNFVRVDLASCPDCEDCRYAVLYAVTATATPVAEDEIERGQSESQLLPPLRISAEAAAAFAGKPGQIARRKRRREKEDVLNRSAPITLHCPHCDMQSRISVRYAGRKGRCPKCKQHVRVPER